MLCFVLATSVLLVDARDIDFLTAIDSMSTEEITVASNDPWLPLVGDTEGVPSMTTGNYEPRAKPLSRRVHNLVESLRKQLMHDNYDYMNKDSAENGTTTTVTTPSTTLMSTTIATNKSMPSTVAVVEKPSIVSSHYNQMLATKVKEFTVMLAQPWMQVASVNVPIISHPFSSVHPPRWPTSARAPPAASHPTALHPSTDPIVPRFRSFNEAFNTPSLRLIQMDRDIEPKLPVFKKDLLYYVVDDRLNTGLHLRRSNDLYNEHNEYGGSENIVEQYEEIDKPTMHDIMQERYNIRRQDRILGRMRRRQHSHKHKHKETEKERKLKGISKRFKQYGLRPKKRPHRIYYNRRTGQNGIQQNGAGDERMEYEQNSQSDDLYNSPRDSKTDNRRSNQYGNQQNEQRNDNFNNHRSGQLYTEQNGLQVDAVDNRRTNFNGYHEELKEKKHHDDKKDIQYNENTQHVETHDKNHVVNKIDGNNKETKIKQELLTELQDKPFDYMDDQPIDKDENNDPEHNVQHDDGQQEDINDDRRSNMQHYSQYGEETKSNVKYKLLKVQPLGSRSRRSGIGAPQHIIQERGSEGVALISLDQAPFPQFRLPRARRQYMHETSNIRHPLVEQLPKANARRSYDGRRRAT